VAEEADAARPGRDRSAHKWSAGAVLVAGGSTGIVGASVFAGRSALNFGAGSVVVASPNAEVVHQIAPQLPTFAFDEAAKRLERFDVVIAGPGLAESDAPSVIPILEQADKVVLDAGGLTEGLLSAAKKDGGEVIITPHAGEYQRLTGRGGGSYSIRAFALEKDITVLLKGNPTQISDGGIPVLVTSGGPELASIGTGDVLAGMIGALWARGLEPMAAAVSGAYWHGRAGSDLRRNGTVTADRLAEHIASFAW
ncbi:MAG: NAD(P)H-hydrate dehydratase, partial [Acidimicrobiia bacterium]|nr:NAD(P)H-hydrate dehydratase [Acidimicrobiia bacterium]